MSVQPIDELRELGRRAAALSPGSRRQRLLVRLEQDLLFYRTLHSGIDLTIRQMEALLATADRGRDPEPPPGAALPPAA